MGHHPWLGERRDLLVRDLIIMSIIIRQENQQDYRMNLILLVLDLQLLLS